MSLGRNKNQTIERITERLLRYIMPVEDISSGSQPKKMISPLIYIVGY